VRSNKSCEPKRSRSGLSQASAVVKVLAALAACITTSSGCSSQTAPSEKPHLLSTPRSQASYEWMLSKTTGELTVLNGCVAIKTAKTAPRTVVFAPDYTLTSVDGKWQIRDSLGGQVGSIGDQVELGGGEAPALNFSDSSGCQGPYWIATPKDRREWVPSGAKPPLIPSDR
jgi:hypothetical protein